VKGADARDDDPDDRLDLGARDAPTRRELGEEQRARDHLDEGQVAGGVVELAALDRAFDR